MKTVLVTGANGQLGHSIRQLAVAYPQFTFLFTDVDTLDICNAIAVNMYVKEQSVDYIVEEIEPTPTFSMTMTIGGND